MDISQGMLLHKSTHHFDAITWLIDDEPARVMAMGNRMYYGDESRSLGPRCSKCERSSECATFKSQSAEDDKTLYFDAEHEDGYIRDRCAFLPDTDIYDNMSVSVQYKSGAILTYSLNLFSMREGYSMVISGERGNIIANYYKHNVAADDMEGVDADVIRITLKEAESETILVPRGGTAHNGSDSKLREMLFSDDAPADTLGQMADSFAGITSAMIGICANESIKNGTSVDIASRLEALR
jgi:predicted dehydrogenase